MSSLQTSHARRVGDLADLTEAASRRAISILRDIETGVGDAEMALMAIVVSTLTASGGRQAALQAAAATGSVEFLRLAYQARAVSLECGLFPPHGATW